MRDYPASYDPGERTEPVPRRVRGYLAGRQVFDTIEAVYVWEWDKYPQYYIPLRDVDASLLVDDGRQQRLRRGVAHRHTLRVGDAVRPGAARVYSDGSALAGLVHLDWAALDSWFEEDEEVFVHPRNPYSRVDALRSSRTVRVELNGAVLAESASPVMVFETGLPTRYYLDRLCVDYEHLTPNDTQSACPYKGRTSAYWTATVGDLTVADVAWCYDFPTRQLLPIAGLVAFYNEKVDVFVDGRPVERPVTPFS